MSTDDMTTDGSLTAILIVTLERGVAMRAAQNRYFRDRSQPNLLASKAAEAAFDQAAKAALDRAHGAMVQEGLPICARS